MKSHYLQKGHHCIATATSPPSNTLSLSMNAFISLSSLSLCPRSQTIPPKMCGRPPPLYSFTVLAVPRSVAPLHTHVQSGVWRVCHASGAANQNPVAAGVAVACDVIEAAVDAVPHAQGLRVISFSCRMILCLLTASP